MNLEKLTIEELLKRYERIVNRRHSDLTSKDVEYKEKVKEELLKRLG
jgi:hypothetical protein